jgi:subtilisin family serine protease
VRSASILASLTALALLAGAAGAAFAREAPLPPRKAVKVAAKKPFALRAQPRAAGPNRSIAQAKRPNPPAISRQDFEKARAEHRSAIAAQRLRLPRQPLPGERGFTGVPPPGETRFAANEMVFHVAPSVSRETVDNVARKLGLSTVESHSVGLTGGTLYHLRIPPGRQVADAVRALEAEKIGTAQPNYVFRAQQDSTLAARSKASDGGQYAVNKLRLAEAHRIAMGTNVLVAVIDSEIDSKHPDLAGAVVGEFDAVGRPDQPHAHGTGMTGAIVAHRQLMGVAPAARIIAVHAFSPDAGESAQATTSHILAGLEWAIKKGARVINMSFAGPYDPMLALAMKKAHDKGIVLVAAAGNAGPKSPPLYPAADPNVIAVTATDQNDRIFAGANQGPHIAVAAPGVDILEPAPNAGYQLTTGTSVAAAHVSGVAALMIERNPALDPDSVHEILTASAKPLSAKGHDDHYGWGLVDPARALSDVDTHLAFSPRPSKPAPSRAGQVSSR